MSGVITPTHSTSTSLTTSQTLPQSQSSQIHIQSNNQTISQSHAALLSSDNVWHALLSRSQRLKSRHSASTLIVLGDKNSGKNALLNHFRDRHSVQSHQSIHQAPNDSLLSYSYLSVKDWSSADVDDVLTVQHVWSLDSFDHVEVLAALLIRGLTPAEIAEMYATCFALIVVDAANLTSVESQASKWHTALAKLRDLMFASLNSAQRHTLLQHQSLHVQSYYNSELHLTPEEVRADVPEINYGMPLLIAVTHIDALSKSNFQSQWPVDDRLECLAYVCRRIALQNGAALAFTSFSQPNSHAINQSINQTQPRTIFLTIQSYIYHRVYGFSLKASPPKAIAVSEDADLWIPAGFDSVDLIESAQTKPGRFTERTRLAEMLTPAAKSANTKTRGGSNSSNGVVKAHENTAFLKLMQASLEKSGGTATVTDLASPVLAAMSSAGKSAKNKSYDSANSSDSGSGPSSATASPRRSHHASSASIGGSSSKANPKGQVAVKAFFKSLLQQPPAGSGSTSAGSGSADATHTKRPSVSSSSAVRKDAEKELKRMSEAQSQQSSQSP